MPGFAFEMREREAEGGSNCACKDGFPESKVVGRFSKDQSEGEKAVRLMDGREGKRKESTALYSPEGNELPRAGNPEPNFPRWTCARLVKHGFTAHDMVSVSLT